MAAPFIFINTYAIKEGKLEGYKEAAPEWFEYVEAKHPRLIHHAVYVNEDGTEVTNVQVHPDAGSMELLMQVIAERHERWHEFIDFAKMSIQVCGTPGDAFLAQMRQMAGSGVPLSVKTPLAGFTRLKAV